MGLSSLDFTLVGVYVVALIGIALWVSREKPGHQKDTADYFLAGKSLPWWAIGASLIAANISAEQVIGMSGSGFAMGLAIASYEWMAAITLVLVAAFLLPIFLKQGIYTMPQFLAQRYNNTVRSTMAVFWLGVYTFVNLTTIMWLGALAINALTGLDTQYAIFALALFAGTYSLYGGLKAVALTDIIQVVMLIVGGILIALIALDMVAKQYGAGAGPLAGFAAMMEQTPQRFDMIFERGHPFHNDLPGLSVLLGGLWIMNLSYWGFNQYIIQRALGAKSLREAQAGLTFAAFLKLIVPFLVVIPGIAAFLLRPDVVCGEGLTFVQASGDAGARCLTAAGEVSDVSPKYDVAYPTMLGFAPDGIKGVIFAALIAAIVSSLGSMINSIATIFTMDIYKPAKPDTSETKLVWIGRGVAFVALVFAVLAAKPLLSSTGQVFQYIQNITGFFTPPICALFILGMFWKRMTSTAALAVAIGGAGVSAVVFVLQLMGMVEMPYMNRVGYVFLGCMVLGVVVSLLGDGKVQDKAIHHGEISFATSPMFKLGAVIILVCLVGFYGYWW